jgi:hypothetical protein
VRLGRRAAARRHLRGVGAADRQGVPGRHRLDGAVPHLRLLAAGPRQARRHRRPRPGLRLPGRGRRGRRGAPRHRRPHRDQGSDGVQVLAHTSAAPTT